MKILVISRNAWDDTNAIGNTLSNFFQGIDNLEFSSVYFREAAPNNLFCKKYYHVTETEIIKKYFVPKKIGKRFSWFGNSVSPKASIAQKNEKRLIRFIRTHHFRLAYRISDYIWYTEKWLNQNFRDFIEAFQPDLMVTFVKSAPQYYLTIKYLRENYHIPLFSWIADDEYTTLVNKKSKRNIKNLQYILDESAIVCGCSQQICDYYNAVFGCEAIPLYKGCDLSVPVKEFTNIPLKIVYAGNLLYGRMEIIYEFSDYIEQIASGKEIFFEIYSNTLLSSEEESFFSEKRYTTFMGQRDYQTIKGKMAEADIVLLVESFDTKQILKTKYSFSTKIIDCMQSGSVLLAVGPKELSSISYVKQIPGTYVIDDKSDLKKALIEILNDENNFTQRAKQVRSYAEMHHEQTLNARKIENILNMVVGEKK